MRNKISWMARFLALGVAFCAAWRAWANEWTDPDTGITWTYTVNDGKASVGRYSSAAIPTSTSGAITIPTTLGGYPVTSIGDSAFRDCSGLTSVTIGDGVTSIGVSAFYNCNGLTSVTIGNSVTSIGDWAFGRCSGLTSVTIGNSVTSIGNYAFYYCSELTSVTIPNSVTSIGSSAFYNCSGLRSVTIGDGVASIGNYAFEDCSGLENVYVSDLNKWCGISFGNDSANPLYYAVGGLYLNDERLSGDLIIPDGVTSIGSSAFRNCSGLTSVTIPDSVTSIGNYAFYNCSELTSVTIPNSMTSIGNYAFYNCSELTSVTIPNSMTSIGKYTFYGCSGLKSVTIPNSVTSIGNYAFFDCSGLTSVTIPEGVTSIGDWAFSGCNGLTSVKIPSSVTSIGECAFYGCSWLTAIEFLGDAPEIGSSAFSWVQSTCIVKVPRDSTGWGVDIPGTWQGMEIVYAKSVEPEGLSGISLGDPFCWATDNSDWCNLDNEPDCVDCWADGEDSAVVPIIGATDSDELVPVIVYGSADASMVSDVHIEDEVTFKARIDAVSYIDWDDLDATERTSPGDIKSFDASRKWLIVKVNQSSESFFPKTFFVGLKGGTEYRKFVIVDEDSDGSSEDGFEDDSETIVLPLPVGSATVGNNGSGARTVTVTPNDGYVVAGWSDEETNTSTVRELQPAKDPCYVMLEAEPVQCPQFGFWVEMHDVYAKDCVCEEHRWADSHYVLTRLGAIEGGARTYVALPVYGLTETLADGDVCAVSGSYVGHGTPEVWTEERMWSTYGSPVKAAYDAGTARVDVWNDKDICWVDDIEYGNRPTRYGASSYSSYGSIVYYMGKSANVIYELVSGIWPKWEPVPGRQWIVVPTLEPATSGGVTTFHVGVTVDGRCYAHTVAGVNKSSVANYLAKNNRSIVGAMPVPFAGGSVAGSGVHAIGETVALAATPNEGYSFAGWFSDGDCTSPLTVNQDHLDSNLQYTVGNGNVIAYAKFVEAQIQTYAVSFDANGGDVFEASREVVEGEPVGELPTPTREGYEFLGWYVGEEQIDETYVAVGDITAVAKWNPNGYSVGYNANGGEGEIGDQEFVYGKSQALRQNTFTRVWHDFAGWATNETGEVVYSDCEIVSNLTAVAAGRVELYAAWVENGVATPEVTPPDGSEFRGDSCVVAISCATEGASIYYTTNGVTPKITSKNLYTVPFVVYGTVSIKAVAAKNDLTSGYATATITKHTLTLAEVLGLDSAVTITSGGGAEWFPVPDATAVGGFSARSGAIDDGCVSWVQVELSGPGTLSFRSKTSCEHDDDGTCTWDRLEILVDGDERTDWRIDGQTEWIQRELVLTTSGSHTIKWLYRKDESDSVGEDCAWLDEVIWTPGAAADPIPAVADDAPSDVVEATVEGVGFADGKVKDVIDGSVKEYNAFKSWAEGVEGGAAAVVESEHAAAAYLLGAEKLFDNAPVIEISEVEVGDGSDDPSEKGTITLNVTVKDGENPVNVAEEKVAAMFEATSALCDWDGEVKLTPTVEVLEGDGNTMRFKVKPGDGTSASAFLRIRR